MKKLSVTLVILIAASLGYASLQGYTPAYLYHAPAVASGIGAKLLCSARYVTGQSRERAFDDLLQYSPVLEYLDVTYDEEAGTVTASLFGLSERTASFQPGIGCAIDFPGHDQRESLTPHELPVLASRWPHGNRVTSIDPVVQDVTDRMVARDNEEGLETRALLIVRNGEVIAESYAGGAGPDTPLLGWSMSKSLISVMLGNLEYRERIDLQGSPEFEAWAGDERAAIRIPHLLTMTDGLDFSEEYDPGDDATTMLFTRPSASAYALQRPLLHEPGTHFSYSSGSAVLLARLHHRHTGGTLQSAYDDYIDNIATPMGFQHATFEVDTVGVFSGSSYFYAPARDWARLGLLMLNEGVINGERLVSRDWVEQAVQPNGSQNSPAYGYQWWLNRGGEELRWPDLPADAFAAQGNREQRVMVIPSRDTVMVRLGWTSGNYPDNERFAELLESL
ncbi:MAG: serine hydrolase [Pseudohongiellaceae bacterium]